ncbi:hypothetical protein PVL29_008384 [Vitis rotundifolia]|uniref:Uncharacterized protein n=1 Tax=Vitis rotundifolia TaxID=103349 RepID=A0AA38ZWA2_VITRO|nr:hypothetical protein PVL29_008384 [Vitis rotundifolia]
MEAMDKKSDVKPTRSFLGKSMRKSLSWYREVRMARNMITALTEKQSATREDMAKMSNAGLSSRFGVPTFSFTPPGTVADVAKATVAMRAATTEHDSEVLNSHSPPAWTRSVCFSVKISFAVSPFWLQRTKKCCGTDLLTNCIVQSSN